MSLSPGWSVAKELFWISEVFYPSNMIKPILFYIVLMFFEWIHVMFFQNSLISSMA
jgi:hypothetical protein